jgi:NAD-dependent oxidoreductase involved in siderophore biosynthesis
MKRADGPDVIRWVLDWLLAHEDSITEHLALECERAARHHWGGDTVTYIARVCEADRGASVRAALADVQGGASPGEAARRHGVDRSTLWRAQQRQGGEPEPPPPQAPPSRFASGGRFGGRR